MPRVPQSKRTVFDKPIGNIRSNVRPQDEAFGGGAVAQSKLRTADAIRGIGAKVQKVVDDFDKTEVEKAGRETQEAYDEQYSRFKLEQLKNPTVKRKEYNDEWTKGLDKIKGKLTDDQREMYAEIEGKFNTRRKGTFGDHEISEQHKYKITENNANIISHVKTASNSYGDPKLALESIEDLDSSYRNLAKNTGKTKLDENGEDVLTEDGKKILTEAGEIGLANAVSSGHLAIIKRAVNEGQTIKAQNYYKKIEKDKRLTPDAREKMTTLMKSSNSLEQSQNLIDTVMKMKLTKSQALAHIRANSKGKTEANAITEYKTRTKEIDNITRETKDNQYEANMNTAFENIRGNKAKGVKANPTWKMPQADFLSMDSDQQKSYTSWTDKLRKGEDIENDWDVWSSLVKDGGYYKTETSSDGTTNKVFVQMSDVKPMNLRMLLDDSHYDKLLTMIKDDKKDKANAALSRKRVVSVNTSVRAYLSKGGVKVTDLSKTQQQRYGNIYSQSITAIEKWQDKNGREATNEEIGKIIGPMTNYGIVKEKDDIFSKTTKLIAFMTPDELGRMEISVDKVKKNKPSLYEAAVNAVEKNFKSLTSPQKAAKVKAILKSKMLKQFNKSKQR